MKTRWTIGKKLIVSFMAVAVITLLLGIVGYYGVNEGGKSINEVGAVRLPSVQSLLTIVEGGLKIKAAQRTLLNPSASDADRKRQPETMAKAKTMCQEARKIYEPLPQTPEGAVVWKEFVPAWAQWEKDNDDLLKINSELEAMGILNPPILQRDLFEFRGTLWKTICSLNKQVKDGVTLQDTDLTNTLLAKTQKDYMQAFKVPNAAIAKILEEIAPANAAMLASLPAIQESLARGEKDAALEQLEKVFTPNAMTLIEGMRPVRGEAEKATQLLERLNNQGMVVCRASQTKVEELLAKLVEINTVAASKTVTASTTMAAQLTMISLIAMIVGVLAALGLGILISRGINKALRRIASNLGRGAEQTAAAAGQVSESSQSMAEGASEQASSLEETSATLEEITSMTKQNAGNATQAANLMVQAKETVGGMARATEGMSQAMSDIKGSADRTAKIVKTIDEIAFQTNLLALNAAVEAARAGDAGKGFAVVAEEVRNLAQRSAAAAKDTSALIEESVNNANNGVQVTHQVAESLQQTVENAEKVAQLINEIAAASGEQTQGIEQVNTAVAQMNQVTQSNAANSEESAAASEELSAQAEQMHQMVQELVAMVGGSGTQTTQSKKPTRTTKAPPPAKAGVAAPKSEVNKRRRALPPPKAADHAVVNAEQVIPLDNEDLDNF